jgi:hypothetical protein
MMSWKGFLRCLMPLVKTIANIFLLSLFFFCTSPAQQDTVIISDEPDTTAFVMQKSAWGAVVRSAVIPGWGQLYNESYVKAVLFWGVGGWLVYNWVLNNNDYNYYRDLYSTTNIETYRRYRTLYRDQRDLFTIYIALTYILNLIDAYVDAHLFDFTVEEDFLIRSPRLNVKVKIF